MTGRLLSHFGQPKKIWIDERHQSTKVVKICHDWVGCLKYFQLSSLFGEMFQFDLRIFFRRVGKKTTNQMMKRHGERIQNHSLKAGFRVNNKSFRAGYPLVSPNIAGWNITIFTRKCIFNPGPFSSLY